MTQGGDADLVRACLAGDNRAWATLILRYKDLVYSIPRRHGLDEEDAADVYQAVCLALWKGLPGLRSEKALTRWIQSTARRQSQKLVRRNRTRAHEGEESLAGVRDEAPTALEAVARAEEEHRVRAALERLSEPCARLLRLLYMNVEGTGYDEVSERLSMPRGSIGPTRARCLEKLKGFLKLPAHVSGERPGGTLFRKSTREKPKR